MGKSNWNGHEVSRTYLVGDLVKNSVFTEEGGK